MYYPYFRGKQYELLAIRESAARIASGDICPIIEPVKSNLAMLERALKDLKTQDVKSIVVVNPKCGDYKDNRDAILEFISRQHDINVRLGILLFDSDDILLASECAKKSYEISMIHGSNFSGDDLRKIQSIEAVEHIFLASKTGDLYRGQFRGEKFTKALIRDGFEQKRNSDYSQVNHFSDLHITYKDRGFSGFGDYLTVGEGYSESGGPAWAVAIHVTVIDVQAYNDMFVFHFVSDSNDTPIDPGKKFLEAVNKLTFWLQDPANLRYKKLDTKAMKEFQDLGVEERYPGLGYVKKLSMKHHIELMAEVQE